MYLTRDTTTIRKRETKWDRKDLSGLLGSISRACLRCPSGGENLWWAVLRDKQKLLGLSEIHNRWFVLSVMEQQWQIVSLRLIMWLWWWHRTSEKGDCVIFTTLYFDAWFHSHGISLFLFVLSVIRSCDFHPCFILKLSKPSLAYPCIVCTARNILHHIRDAHAGVCTILTQNYGRNRS